MLIHDSLLRITFGNFSFMMREGVSDRDRERERERERGGSKVSEREN